MFLFSLPTELQILILQRLSLEELAVLQDALPSLGSVIKEEAADRISSIFLHGKATALLFFECEKLIHEWIPGDYREQNLCCHPHLCWFEHTGNEKELSLVASAERFLPRFDHTCEHAPHAPSLGAVAVTWELKDQAALQLVYGSPGTLCRVEDRDAKWPCDFLFTETVRQTLGGFALLSAGTVSAKDKNYWTTLPPEWCTRWLSDAVSVTIQFRKSNTRSYSQMYDCRCPIPYTYCTTRTVKTLNLKWTLRNAPPCKILGLNINENPRDGKGEAAFE